MSKIKPTHHMDEKTYGDMLATNYTLLINSIKESNMVVDDENDVPLFSLLLDEKGEIIKIPILFK